MIFQVSLKEKLDLKSKRRINNMKTGVVKMWDNSKGFGFIEDDEGWDYFLNISKVRQGQKIREGDKVKFDVFEGQRGPSAVNVTKY